MWHLEPAAGLLGGYTHGKVVAVEGTLFATDSNGYLYARDLATGEERWRVGIGGGMNGRGPDGVLASGDTVYVWFDRWLYAFMAGCHGFDTPGVVLSCG